MARQRSRGGLARTLLLLVCAALLAAPATMRRGIAAEPRTVADLGLLWEPDEDAPPGAAGVVIALYDSGIDQRGWRYGAQITAAGIAVLHMEIDDVSADGIVIAPAGDADAVALARLATALDRLEADPRFARAPVGLLAFGAAGRPALLAAAQPALRGRIAALALLYPGCAALDDSLDAIAAPPRAPVLLLHGDADPANPRDACGRLAARLERAAPVRHLALAGAGHAWDLAPYGLQVSVKLPWPHRTGSVIVADFWPQAADVSAAQAASFFAAILPAHGL